MSAEAMKWARQQRFGSMQITHLVNAIASRASRTGAAWPSQQTLAADMGTTARHIRRLLATTDVLGVIQRNRRSGGRHGRLPDMLILPLHKAFNLSAADVRKARATGQRGPVAAESSKRTNLTFPSGQRGPGNKKGNKHIPSHREETYQKEALAAGPVRLAAVGGVVVEGGR